MPEKKKASTTTAETAPSEHCGPRSQQVAGMLVLWLGDCRNAMRRWIHGPDAHRRILVREEMARRRLVAARRKDPARALSLAMSDEPLDVEPLTPTSPAVLEISAAVDRADRARRELMRLAIGRSYRGDPISTPELLIEWAVNRCPLIMRLARAGFVPLPPEMVRVAIERNDEALRPSRTERLVAEPDDSEDILGEGAA